MIKRIISMLLVLCMLGAVVSVQAFAKEHVSTRKSAEETVTTLQQGQKNITNPFKDVSESDWYYDSVMYALKNGLLMGTGDDTFSPGGTMTRAMFVTLLGRIAKIDAAEYSNGSVFTDVVPGSYYEPYVKWASEKGITSGIGNGMFDPNGLVTREQMAAFLVRYFNAYKIPYPEATVTTVPNDIDSVAGWAKDAVLKLWACGIFLGDNGNFNPGSYARRSEAAALSQRINEITVKWLAETDDNSDETKDDKDTSESDSDTDNGDGGRTIYYKVDFKAPENLVGATMPEGKLYPSGTAISSMPTPYKQNTVFIGWYYDEDLTAPAAGSDIITRNMTLYAKFADSTISPAQADTPNFLTVVDVDTDFTFQVKAVSAEAVKNSLSIRNITSNNKEIAYVVSGDSSPFTVTADYAPGETYKAELAEDSGTVFVYRSEQPESTRILNFITKMDEVMSLSLSDKIKYVPKSDVSNISGNAFDGLFNLSLNNGLLSADDTNGGGTFTYSGGGIDVGDTVSIYSGIRPDKRDLTTNGSAEDGDVAYVIITGINGTTYTYIPADSKDVLFTPDVLPIPVSEDTDNDPDNDSVTIASSTVDYSDDKYASLNLDSQTTVDKGDFIALYTGNFGENSANAVYGRITDVTRNEDQYIIDYEIVTLEDVYAAMDIYHTRNEEIELTEEEINNIERNIEAQADSSGFIDESVNYLTLLAMNTDGFRELSESLNLKSLYAEAANAKGNKLTALSESRVKITDKKIEAIVAAGKVLQHFDGSYGVRAELALTFTAEITPKKDSDNKIEITVQAIFEQEVLLSINVSGGAIWEKAWIFPYIYDYRLNANFDVGTFTGVGITATAKTTGPEEDDIGFDWKPVSGTKAEEKIINIGQQITELMEMKEVFLGEKLVDEFGDEVEWAGTNGGGLAEKYAAMLEEADESWIELFRKEIFSNEGFVDPFHILVYGISADFVVSANMYVTMGMTFEYGNAKRYNFSLMLFHKKSTNETIDLEAPHYQFDFYVMGTMGVKAGIEFEVGVGLFSLKLDSIGITAEAGVYAQLWGYFYYHYLWEKGTGGAPDTREISSSGAMLIEIGAYLKITFKAQLFSSEKLTYQPTLLDKTWPILTIGSAENVFDFNYGEDETPSFEIKRVKVFTLPTSLFEMQYMDLKTGEIYGGEDSDEEHPANSFDDETESRFIIEITNKAFRYDPATNTVTVVPDENSMRETGEMTITWKNGTLAFTSKPISRTIKFKWEDPSTGRYISFDSMGGSPVDMIFAKEGSPIARPEDPKKQGYDFAGWYMNKSYSAAFAFPSAMPDYPEPEKGITVYAKWTPAINTYKVEHYLQGLDGKFTLDAALTQIKRDKGTEEMTAAVPYSIPGYTARPISQEKVAATGSTLIKINYERNRYTLKFTYGELAGEENPDIVYTYKYGSSIFAPRLALGGYIFDGWNSEILETMPANDVTYSARWKPDPNTPYRVEYYFQNANGAGYTYVSMESKSGETGSEVDCASLAKDAQGMTYSYATVEGRQETSARIKADGTLIVKLYYDRNMYDVTFNSKGGSEVTKLSGVRYGAAVERPADPTRAGYTFGGWYKDEACSDGQAFDFSLDKMPAGNLTLYAKWVAESYRVVFDANGGSGSTQPQDFTYDVEKALTANGFTRTGYTFAGWNTDRDGNGILYSDCQTVSNLATEGSIVLYAQWTLNSYKVRFNVNGGTGLMEDQTFNYDEMKALSENTFTRTGYTFDGWADSADGLKLFDDKDNVRNLSTENGAIINLYAKWKANTYTVIFNGNGEGVKGSMANQGFTYDESPKALTANSFTRTGYTFDHWNTSADGSGTSYGDGQPVSNLAAEGSIVLYAVWKGNEYTVTLNDGDGTGGSGSISATYGSDLPSVEIPDRTGYEFHGYYDGQNGAGTCYYSADGNSAAVWDKDSDTTLYAYWIANSYTLTLHAAGGTVALDYKTVTFGEAYGDLPVPTRNGYTFEGWFTAADGGAEVDSDTEVSVAEDHDIYAHWTANTYTVVFNGNGTGVTGYMAEQSFTYDESPKALTANSFTRTGYTFGGWATSSAGSKVYDDQAYVSNLTAEKDGQYNLYAAWNANTYFVRFHGNGEDVVGTMDDQSFAYDEGAKALTANRFTRIGYTFGGWALSPDGEAEYSNSESVQNLVAENGAVVDLYAKWTPGQGIEYTVKHWQQNVNDNEYTLVNEQTLTGTTGMTTDARVNTYTGFTAKPIVQGTIAGDGTTVVDVYYDRDIHYAVWETNGGTYVSNVPLRFGQVITAPDEPTREGYNFTGWTWEENSTPVKNIPETVKMGTADKTFTANWSPITYIIEFNTGDGSPVQNQTIEYKGKVTRPEDPSREGYTFGGWYTGDTFAEAYDFDKEVIESFTLYAKWNIKTYTVTFESKGGGAVAEQRADHGSTAQKPDDPVREGYTFDGWYIDEEYKTAFNFNTPVTSDLTLYAKWSKLSFTVTFDSKGGSAIESQKVDYNEMAAEPPVPVREGYIFGGWYIDKDYNTVYDFDTAVTSNLTLYAKWSPITYSVVFNKNSEAAEGSMEVQSFVYDKAEGLTVNGFTRTGYTFDGWNTKADGTGKNYEDEEIVSNLSAVNEGTVNLYAKWQANRYTVRFNGNGSTSGSMADQNFFYDIAQNLSANGFSRTGYSFSGWNTKDDGTGTSYAAGAQVRNLLSENNAFVTLYAQWTKEQYTITFKYDSNNVYRTIKQDYGTQITPPANPERTGYDFNGWNVEIPETMPAQDLTLTAKWTPTVYTITYNLDGGTFSEAVPDTYTIEDGFALPRPTKTGYVFTGWTGTGLSTKTLDVTVEAGSYGARTYNANWQMMSTDITVIGKNGITYTLNGSGTITLPSALEGAIVLAWFQDADFKTEITTYTVQGTANETIYAWLYSSSDPCLIQSYNDLVILKDRIISNSNGGRWRSGNYKLGYRDSTPVTITIENVSWIGISSFEGTFDGNRGNDCKIQFNYKDNVNLLSTGLFSSVSNNGIVKNVEVTGWLGTLYSTNFGSIANQNFGTIEDCVFSGTITKVKEGTGGIVGLNGGTVRRCTLSDNVTIDAIGQNSYGTNYVGGIAGKNTGSIIGENTIINGLTVKNGAYYVGGIVGENSGVVSGYTVQNSLISPYRNQDNILNCMYAGGIAGKNASGASITNCSFISSSVVYNNGGVYFGGICGYNEGSVSQCTVSGKKQGQTYTLLNGDFTGGIAGYNINGGTLSYCNVSNISTYSIYQGSGGIAGCIYIDGSISNCSVEGTTQIVATKYTGGLIGMAAINSASVTYRVSDCTVGSNVTVSVKAANSTQAGALIGNPEEHESYGTDYWLTNSTSDANIITH